MNKDTVELLRECDAGTKTAVNSFKEVLDNVQSQELMSLLQESLSEHQSIGDELHAILDKEGVAYTKLLADENKEFATQLEIKQAPTLVMIKDGEISKFAGVSDIKKALKV